MRAEMFHQYGLKNSQIKQRKQFTKISKIKNYDWVTETDQVPIMGIPFMNLTNVGCCKPKPFNKWNKIISEIYRTPCLQGENTFEDERLKQ
jgi:hypothetical protein